MKRRTLIQSIVAALFGAPVLAAVRESGLDAAADVLENAAAEGLVASAVLHVRQSDFTYTRAVGGAGSEDAMFLLGSISKPICMTALMTLLDQGKFQLEDRVQRYLPEFTGDGRDAVTMLHLLTHVSGLPDQLAENDRLRSSHAPLAQFVEQAQRTPLEFAPGSRYQYSSMGILLAARVAEILSGMEIRELVDRVVFQPLEMSRSAQGLGRFALSDFVPVQTDRAAPESGGGDPSAKDWDWNSAYWRALGAPWGGTHASAPDVGRFLAELLDERGTVLQPATARLMVRNHNRPGLAPRGLAFDVRASLGGPQCSAATFGHTGSTGTLAWADPATRTICVVLTSLPARAVTPHPRDLVSARVAAAT